MAGLLKQLQKAKPTLRQDSQQAVIRTRPEPVESLVVLDQVVEDASVEAVVRASEMVQTEADALLAELTAESRRSVSKIIPVNKSKPSRVVRRNQSGSLEKPSGLKDDSVPWWLTEAKEEHPQVDRVLATAERVLAEFDAERSEPLPVVERVRAAIQGAAELLREEVRLPRKVLNRAEAELLSLLAGKGPLGILYDDQAVTDIFIDSYKSIKVIRRGHALETPFSFRSAAEFRLFVNSLLESVGRKLGPQSPIVDCVLHDEWRSRINAIDPSLIDGEEPRVCIRIPRLQKISFYDILQTKTLPATLASWLAEVVALGEANILVLGPTGSGKTVMTTALLSAVNSDERIITIEDVPELFVPTCHLEKLVVRPASPDGEIAVTMPDLLRAALRRSPHRIVVGEIRDEEGRLFLRALETGHAGSIATIHADNARDALWRLLDLVASYELSPQPSIMRRIARSVHLAISLKQINGAPCVTEVAEVLTPYEEEFRVRPLVTYLGEFNGKRRWQLHSDDSYWVSRVAAKGLRLMPGPGLVSAESA